MILSISRAFGSKIPAERLKTSMRRPISPICEKTTALLCSLLGPAAVECSREENVNGSARESLINGLAYSVSLQRFLRNILISMLRRNGKNIGMRTKPLPLVVEKDFLKSIF
jgi:hypothetical protein